MKFHLKGGLVTGLREVLHKCEMRVRMRISLDLFPNSDGKEAVSCTEYITTYYGAFIDPCSLPATPLPQHLHLTYYFLPDSQRQASELALAQFTSSPAGNSLVFIKAMTISLTVPPAEEELVYICSYRVTIATVAAAIE